MIKRRSDSLKVKGVSAEKLRGMYATMLRIRRLEETIGELVANKEIVCPCHLYIGEEAVATGVGANLRKEDWVFSTHRSHGHYLAKGGDINALMAELYGKATGCARGRGGSMHLASPDIGLPGSSAIVAGTIPLAVGAALAFKLQKRDSVAVAFFGDGAIDEGVFYESMNLASLQKLPVVFVCENNLYSTHMPIASCLADTDIHKKASAFGMPGVRIDGNDVLEVYEASGRAIDNARRGRGPALIEAMTYRWRGHVGPSEDIDKGLRSQEELDSWKARCPIKTFEGRLVKQGLLTGPEKAGILEKIEEEIKRALAFAKESPFPEPAASADASVFKR